MERHAKSLKSPLKTCSFAPRISRIYPSAKGDEDLIPWVGIIGVAFCQKILRFTICAVFFSIGIWKSLVILGYLLPAEIHSCPKGKYIFFGRGIYGPRKIHLQQSHLQQPLLRQGVRGKFLGQNPLVERWFPNNVELSRWESSCHPVVSSLSRIPWFSWRCLKSPGKWPSAQKQRILVFVPSMICWKKSKKLSYYNQTESRQAINGSMTTCLALPQYFRHLVFLARVWEKPFRILRWWGCNQPCRWSFSSTKS